MILRWRWKLLAWFSHRAAGIFFRGTSMKSKLLGFIALIPLLGLSPANATTYNYAVAFPAIFTSPSATTVTGTISTDCSSSCLLAPSDFLSWSFTFSGYLNATFSGGPSGVSETSTPNLEAFPLVLQYVNPFVADGRTTTFSSGGDSLAFSDLISSGSTYPGEILLAVGGSGQTGTEINLLNFATLTGTSSGPSATPLPAALPLFASGLGALGLLGWRRKRKNAAAIAA